MPFGGSHLALVSVLTGALLLATPSVAQAAPPASPPAAAPSAPAAAAPSPILQNESPSASPAKPAPRPLAPNEPPSVPTPGPEVLAGRPASADHLPPLHWDYAPISTPDYIIAATAGAITLAAAIMQPLSKHNLQGGILFDNAVRDAVRPGSIRIRYDFRDASDVGLSLMATWPFFADALATAWWYRGDRDTAQQMALLDLETLAISGAIQGATNVLVSRQRPYGQDCGTSALPGNALDCGITPEYRSFFSGHSAFSFTSAALICLNHTKMELLGPPWDALTCAGSYVAASATASFRVMADEHYASDVIMGALVGTLVGYGVPWLHSHKVDIGSVKTSILKLQLVPSLGGAGVLGTF